MTKYLALGAAGFLGALARYVLRGYVANLTGAFALGLLATVGVDRALLPPLLLPPATISFAIRWHGRREAGHGTEKAQR